MKRYRTFVPIVFLALFAYQTTGTSLVYSFAPRPRDVERCD